MPKSSSSAPSQRMLRVGEQVRLGMAYVGQFADSVTVNAVQANLAWRF